MSKFCVKAAILFSLAIAEQLSTAAEPVATQVEPTTDGPNATEKVEVTTVEPIATEKGGASEKQPWYKKKFNILEKLDRGFKRVVNIADKVKQEMKDLNKMIRGFTSGEEEETKKLVNELQKKLVPISVSLQLLIETVKVFPTDSTKNFVQDLSALKQKVNELKSDANLKKDEFLDSIEKITALVTTNIDGVLGELSKAKNKVNDTFTNWGNIVRLGKKSLGI